MAKQVYIERSYYDGSSITHGMTGLYARSSPIVRVSELPFLYRVNYIQILNLTSCDFEFTNWIDRTYGVEIPHICPNLLKSPMEYGRTESYYKFARYLPDGVIVITRPAF